MRPMIKTLALAAVVAASMVPAAAQAGWCGCRPEPPRPFLGFLEPLVEAAPNVFLTEPVLRDYPRVTCCSVRTRHYTFIPSAYGPLYVQPDLYVPHYVHRGIYRHHHTRRYMRHVRKHWND
jgi:hypothetical protein